MENHHVADSLFLRPFSSAGKQITRGQMIRSCYPPVNKHIYGKSTYIVAFSIKRIGRHPVTEAVTNPELFGFVGRLSAQKSHIGNPLLIQMIFPANYTSVYRGSSHVFFPCFPMFFSAENDQHLELRGCSFGTKKDQHCL